MTGAWRSGARLAVTVAACSTSVALAACGGGGDEAGASDESQRERFQEAGLKFAECMRGNGVDVPDPKPGPGGGGIALEFRGGAEDQANFRDAQEECQHYLEDARPELSEEEQAKFRDAALKFSRCMREQGIDFPDPTFDSQGRANVGPPSGEDGPRPDDPAFREAAEKCRENMPGGGPMFRAGP